MHIHEDAVEAARQVPGHVAQVVKTLVEAGEHAVVVGGAVRDVVMGITPGDFDVATSALPERVMKLFGHTVPTGLQHGTVTVVVDRQEGGRENVEVTTFRTEGGYQDGRRPETVAFGASLLEDLSRRDFTVNAMALHLFPEPRLEDPFEGHTDLQQGVLRTVGAPAARFGEDGLRAVRAARFAAQLNLAAAPGLEDAMRDSLPVVQKVSVERFFQELQKLMAKSPRPSVALGMLARTGLLAWMAPGAPEDAASFARVDRVPLKEEAARFAAWLWDAGKPGAMKAMLHLRASRALAEDVAMLASLPRPNAVETLDDAALRALVRTISKARVPMMDALYRAEGAGPLMERVGRVLAAGYLESPVGLALNGTQLGELTGASGRSLGMLMKTLLLEVDRDPAINTADALAARARVLSVPTA